MLASARKLVGGESVQSDMAGICLKEDSFFDPWPVDPRKSTILTSTIYLKSVPSQLDFSSGPQLKFL